MEIWFCECVNILFQLFIINHIGYSELYLENLFYDKIFD